MINSNNAGKRNKKGATDLALNTLIKMKSSNGFSIAAN